MAAEKHYKADFGFKPYPKQQDIIDHMEGRVRNANGDLYRFFVVVFGRQSGKSWLAKYVVLDRAINQKQTCMWVAPALTQVRQHWNDLVSLIKNSGLPVKKIREAQKEILFYGGGAIYVRSVIEPENLRGPTLDLLVLDEAAFFRRGEEVWFSVLQPMITASRGQVLFVTTPNGRNWLWNVFREGENPDSIYYKSWRMSSLDSPYQDRAMLLDIKKRIPLKRWQEEYLAEFLADAGGVFSGVLEAAVTPLLDAPVEGHDYVAGVDWGFNHDHTCFTVLDKFTREQVYGERWSGVGTISSVRRLVELMERWRPKITVFEKNGLGETFFDLLRAVLSDEDPDPDLIGTIFEIEEYNEDTPRKKEMVVGDFVVRAIHMNNELKRAFVEGLSADIEYGRLKLLTPDCEYGDKQINEMSTYERKRTQSGLNITYEAKDGDSDDTISALYLARRGLPKYKRRRFVKPSDEKRKNPFKGGGGRRLGAKKNAKRD